MKVLLVNPMVAPQVQQTARALNEAGQLHAFVTTFRYDPSSPWQALAKAGARLLGRDLDAMLRRRLVTEVPMDRVVSVPHWELLRLAVAKTERSGISGDVAWEFAELAFSAAAARRIVHPVDTVYSYEYCATRVFEAARAKGLRIVYETPAAEPSFVIDTLQQEIAAHPSIATRFNRYEIRKETERIARRRQEWHAADVVVANSAFTRATFEAAGLDVSKVRVVPLGAPEPVSAEAAAAGGSRGEGPLRLVWAGKFSAMKGAHYLLEALRDPALARSVVLDVYGDPSLPRDLADRAPQCVRFRGRVPRAELWQRFQEADLLVFPTLSDGFGMVATEAWSRGLPVMMTRRAGVCDRLADRRNGLLVEHRSPGALAEALAWCCGHRPELAAMRLAARDTAAGWQWPDYRAALAAAIAPPGTR